ncbi:MAG TPA: PilC/PilY family type IV pilus protein [Rhodocyclaceae bacterium]
MRIYGYNYGDGTYLGTNGDNCTWQQTSVTQGQCRSWGNPMAEIFYEGLRYFAGNGKTATPDYAYGASSADATLGLPVATWRDPLDGNNYCSPLTSLVFNASVSTNEYNKSSPAPSSTQGTTKFDLATKSLDDINAGTTTPAEKTDAVGAGEHINGNSYFVGKAVSDGSYVPASGTTNYELCTSKQVAALGKIYGICPEGPTLEGSYLMSGLAYQAHMNRIRTDLTILDPTDTKSLKVTTYGVQLATNVPRLAIPVPGSTTGQQVVIQPAYRLDMGSRGMGGGMLVDMQLVYRSVSSTTATGQVYLNWEDSEQGGDYDQDVWGILRYCVTVAAGGCDAAMGLSGTLANSVYVMTNTIAYSTGNPQGFGYIVSGTTQDGPHFHSGILNYKFADPQHITIVSPANLSSAHLGTDGGCGTDTDANPPKVYSTSDGKGCQVGDPLAIARYTLSSSATTNALQDPLYYAAKWGSFTDTNGNGIPDTQAEWDSKKSDGTAGADGNPDTYFLVSNPLALEQALNTAFVFIVNSSSAASVATNSTSLSTDTVVYQGRFNPANWAGELLACRIQSDPECTTPLWDAGITSTPNETRLQQIARNILTFKPSTQAGAAFQWDNLDSAQQNYLENISIGATPTAGQISYGQAVLGYLRGSGTNEGAGALHFRSRVTTKLGDIVDSAPLYVGVPQGEYSNPNLFLGAYLSSSTYASWRNTNKDRPAMLYVGANDGMLHGFDAATGVEKLGFIPNTVYRNLTALVSPTYNDPSSTEHKYFVDGSPSAADVEFTTGWRTALVSGLGKGGRAVFALDVTDPSVFSETNTDTVLWEFSSASTTKDSGGATNTDAGELGYVYGKPLIAKMNNGKWAAVFGNGYNSNSNTASLFIVFIEDAIGGDWVSGSNYIRIATGIGSAGNPNGLSTINAIDTDGNGTIDYVYGGDLLGNLWKFDVSSGTSSNWAIGQVAGSQRPLFVACTGPASGTSYADSCPAPYARQPITVPPELSFNPVYQNDVMVYFGTGRYLTMADPGTSTTQTVYGIRDSNTTSITGTSVRPSRANLQPQTIIASPTVDGARTFQTIVAGDPRPDTSYTVDWTTKYGWYEDLPATGERVIAAPALMRGILYYDTFVPSTNPCLFGGSSYSMAVGYETGGMPNLVVFKTGTTFANSTIVAGVSIPGTLGGGINLIPRGSRALNPGGFPGGTDQPNTDGKRVFATDKGLLTSLSINPGAMAGTRISWRELNP